MGYFDFSHKILVAAVLLSLAAAAGADTHAYRGIGEHGEVTFSDVPSRDASLITLAQPVSNLAYPSHPTSSAEQVALMLQVADELAIARQAREQSRAQRLERVAQREAEQRRNQALLQRQQDLERQYEPRFFYPRRSYHPDYPHYPDHKPAPAPAPAADRPQRSFKFELR